MNELLNKIESMKQRNSIRKKTVKFTSLNVDENGNVVVLINREKRDSLTYSEIRTLVKNRR